MEAEDLEEAEDLPVVQPLMEYPDGADDGDGGDGMDETEGPAPPLPSFPAQRHRLPDFQLQSTTVSSLKSNPDYLLHLRSNGGNILAGTISHVVRFCVLGDSRGRFDGAQFMPWYFVCSSIVIVPVHQIVRPQCHICISSVWASRPNHYRPVVCAHR